MFNLYKQLKSKRIILGVIMVLVLAGLIIPLMRVDAQSGIEKGIAEILTWIVMGLVTVAGKVLLIFIDVLVGVAQYNQFIGSRAVSIGWKVVRDIANLFFVLIILVIAFGTLFKIQTYEYKKLLPKLIMAVILVNFSKMIVGVAIDFGQVIMLTFVNAFQGVAAGAVVNGLGLDAMLELGSAAENLGGSIDHWSVFGAVVLGLVMLVIACVTVLALIVVLLFRIIMLWILIIFAPFAFVASIIPANPLQKVGLFGQYWNYLSRYIIIGPILAFFLWLSFSILMYLNTGTEQHIIALHRSEYELTQGVRTAETQQQYVQYLASKVSSPQNMFDYMVTIALLIGSLIVTQQMGVMGGAMGMGAVNKIKSSAGRWSSKAGRATALGIGRKLDRGSIRAQQALGKKEPMSLRPSVFKPAWQASRKRKEEAFYKERGIAGGMEDKFNRLMSWSGKDKTYKQGLEQDRHIAAKEKEIEEGPGGNNEDALAMGFKRADSNSEKVAFVRRLTGIHGINTLAKDGSRKEVQKLIKEHFGDGEEGARVMADVENRGLNNKDPQFWGGTQINSETGKAEWVKLEDKDFDSEHLQERFNYYKDKGDARFDGVETFKDVMKSGNEKASEVMLEEKQEKLSRDMQSKKTGRNAINTLTRDAYLLDKKGELSIGAKQMVLATADQMGSDYKFTSPELRDHLSSPAVLDALKDFATGDEIKDVEKKKQVHKMMGRVINPDGGGDDFFAGDEILDKEEVAEKFREHTVGRGGTIKHEEEIIKKTTTIEELNREVEEDEEARERIKMDTEKGTDSDEWKEKNKVVENKKERIKNLEQDIYAKHQPAMANEFVQGLDEEAFKVDVNPKIVSDLSDNLTRAINNALKDVKPDGSGFSDIAGKLNKDIDKLKQTLKDENQGKALNFASLGNMEKVKDPDLQKGILDQLKFVVSNLAKKGGGKTEAV